MNYYEFKFVLNFKFIYCFGFRPAYAGRPAHAGACFGFQIFIIHHSYSLLTLFATASHTAVAP